MLEVLLRHRQHITGVCQEYHILILALLEVLQLRCIIALNPARLIQVYGFPATFGVILVLQSILDDLELQLTNGTYNLTAIELVDKQLGNALVHQLVNTLLQLLRLHGIVVLNVLEQLRGERRQSAKVQLFTLRQRVANLKDTIIGSATVHPPSACRQS